MNSHTASKTCMLTDWASTYCLKKNWTEYILVDLTTQPVLAAFVCCAFPKTLYLLVVLSKKGIHVVNAGTWGIKLQHMYRYISVSFIGSGTGHPLSLQPHAIPVPKHLWDTVTGIMLLSHVHWCILHSHIWLIDWVGLNVFKTLRQAIVSQSWLIE